MIAAAKLVMLALSLTAVGAVAATSLPMTKAIDVHNDHLMDPSKLPEGGQAGNQNALNHLMQNLERWIVNNSYTAQEDNDTNETD
jgi:hypothetical protein